MYKSFLILFLVSVLNLYAQEKWNIDSLRSLSIDYLDTAFTVNSVKIRYQEYSVPDENYMYGGAYFFRMKVTDKNNLILQVIDSESHAISNPLDNDGYNILADSGITLDYNFDGYEDLAIRIKNGRDSYAVNAFFDIYLFNPKTKTFYKYIEELLNPIPYPNEKLIRSIERLSATSNHYFVKIYKWEEEFLNETERIEYKFQEMYRNNTEAIYKVIKQTIRNGKVIRTEESKLKESDIQFIKLI